MATTRYESLWPHGLTYEAFRQTELFCRRPRFSWTSATRWSDPGRPSQLPKGGLQLRWSDPRRSRTSSSLTRKAWCGIWIPWAPPWIASLGPSTGTSRFRWLNWCGSETSRCSLFPFKSKTEFQDWLLLFLALKLYVHKFHYLHNWFGFLYLSPVDQ